MLRGDVVRLTLSGKGVASDVTWVPGAIAASFPMDVVRIERTGPQLADVTVRARGQVATPAQGAVLRSPAAVLPVPGFEPPSAKIEKVEQVDIDLARSGELNVEEAPASLKWFAALALIGVTMFLSSRIKE